MEPFKTPSTDPYFHGFEMIEELLPPCKVIISSGYISPEITTQAKRLGVAFIFQKPANFNQLALLINHMVVCAGK